jgi:low temperature requirement protein LtrA
VAEEQDEPVAERHATWAELFFDLIAVAAIAALAHVLVVEVTPATVGLYLLLFLAFWLSWTAFMLYGNILGADVDIGRLFLGMFGIGVMAVAMPGVVQVVIDDGTDVVWLKVFAIAYFVIRIVAAKTFEGRLVTDFPITQQTIGAVPWLASVWVSDPGRVVVFWAIGIAVDVVGVVMVSGEEVRVRSQKRLDAVLRRVEHHPRAADPAVDKRIDRFRLEPVQVAAEHLSERLGLFVIIALGEGVVQVVAGAQRSEPAWRLLLAGFVAFVLLAGVFALSELYGDAGVPHLRSGRLAMRFALGLHALVTASIAALAVAVAAVVEHERAPLGDDQRWLLCGAVAAYFLVGFAGALATRTVHWLDSSAWLATGVGVPVLVGLLGSGLGAILTAALLAAVVLLHVGLEQRVARAA